MFLHTQPQHPLQVFIVLILCSYCTTLAFISMVRFQETLLFDLIHHNLLFRLLSCRFLPVLSLLFCLKLKLRRAREMSWVM